MRLDLVEASVEPVQLLPELEAGLPTLCLVCGASGGEPLAYPTCRQTHYRAGRANFAASTGTLGCTSVNTTVERPSSHVIVKRKGILTPATSR